RGDGEERSDPYGPRHEASSQEAHGFARLPSRVDGERKKRRREPVGFGDRAPDAEEREGNDGDRERPEEDARGDVVVAAPYQIAYDEDREDRDDRREIEKLTADERPH